MISQAEQMRTYFVEKSAPTTAWMNAIALYSSLPRLRAFWPISSANEAHSLFDFSEQARTLTRGHAAATGDMGNTNLAVYIDVTAASSQYWSRADEAGLDVLGAAHNDTGLTIGAWVWFDAESIGTTIGILTKWVSLGDQRAYRLIKDGSDLASFGVSSAGTLGTVVESTNTNITLVKETWYFVAGVMTPSTSLVCWVDLDKFTNIVGVPANVFASTAAFQLASYDDSFFLDGKIAFPFLCAAPLSDTIIKSIYHQTRALFNK